MRAKHRTHKCRRCGQPIEFVPAAGFTVRGEKKRYIAVNPDDRQAHWPRCQSTQAANELKKAVKAEKARKRQHTAIEPLSQQQEIFDGLKS